MTLTDIRRNILESADPDWFNSVEEIFNFHYVGTTIPFKGVSSIYEFLIKQIDGWNKFGDSIPSELLNSKKYFEQIRNQIDNLITSYKNSERNQLQGQWASIRNSINNTNRFPLKYNSSEVDFLLKVYQDYPESFISAFNFTISSNSFNVNSKQALIGSILAYEFSLKDASLIVKRSNAEKSSLKAIKNDLEKHFSDAESQLSEHLKLINDKFVEYTSKIDTLKTEKNEVFTQWFDNTKTNFTTFDTELNKNIKALESTYEELLRLKKPADYWKIRAIDLKKEGWTSLKWLVGLIVLACLVLYSLLWLTPEGMLKSFFDNDKSAALRWSIIFITLISFLAYGIKALTKVTFSSFHLARDAEERERLTYVYLAMVKDSSMDKEDRHLIMQSLFSRADTGLLREDSSPTMPGAGSVIEKVIKQ